MGAPNSLLEIASRTEERLRALLEAERQRWVAIDPDLGVPLDALTDFVLSGGKRLRPAFCYWAFVGAGGAANDDVVVDTGAAFELLQAFALLHDDVMDGSDRRRGVDTAHRSFEALHRNGAWRGEPRRFGEGVAILMGDLAFVYADVLMTTAPARARVVFDEMRVELNVGQYLDVLGTARGNVDLATARRIVSYKSARYTIERPLHVGAALTERLDELEAPLTAYGRPLGEAFQLRDDVLGAFGDVTATGKPVGDDLREGKPTPLMAIATERAHGPSAALLARVGAPDLSTREVAELQSVLVDTGALDEVERSITVLTEEAVEAVKEAPLTSEAQVALTELATYVAERDR